MKRLAVLLVLLMILAAFPVAAFAAESSYKDTLFDRSAPIEIDIQMDDAAWDNMIATAEDEEYSSCTLVVNGEIYENVAIRPKGNSSMMTVTNKNSERYSWRIKFDKYEKGRTCDGLDILILNNGVHDPGNLQEAISFDMYAFLEADASLINYAVVCHNGEYFGVYLALEGVDESFVETRYDEKGELYKPEMGGGRGGVNTSALNYAGDDLSSYQSIWNSAKFKSDEEDYARVVEAIKHVCGGDDIAGYLYVDNVLKYFAIQTFIYNHDGLTGNVAHNYYLYEQDGKLNLFPWDLNESFTVSGNGSAYVNFPIDTPFTVNDLSQRSFFMALLENEEYLAQYHEYLRQLSEEYVQGGVLASFLESIFSQVEEYYKTDPTAFADYDTITARAESLQTVIGLRAESVLGQIDGSIPSTRDGQNAEPEKLLDTSGADLSGLTGSSGEMRWRG